MDRRSGPLVVGVDGSPGALAALRWSVGQARLLRTDVVAVHAWQPSGALRAPYAPVVGSPTAADDRSIADRLLRDAVSHALDTESGMRLRLLLAEGPPVPVLIARAEQALLLVLGRRLRDDPAWPALGTVARECMRRAPCPVVMVPESSHGPSAAAAAVTGVGRQARGACVPWPATLAPSAQDSPLCRDDGEDGTAGKKRAPSRASHGLRRRGRT
ncbi:universal stress protein [Streptomyces sp. BH097]|uniref:universal stress protein n=1 Tax=unclassified Streptomyces TaxID=2593676 RepID=UPI003BB48D5C